MDELYELEYTCHNLLMLLLIYGVQMVNKKAPLKSYLENWFNVKNYEVISWSADHLRKNKSALHEFLRFDCSVLGRLNEPEDKELVLFFKKDINRWENCADTREFLKNMRNSWHSNVKKKSVEKRGKSVLSVTIDSSLKKSLERFVSKNKDMKYLYQGVEFLIQEIDKERITPEKHFAEIKTKETEINNLKVELQNNNSKIAELENRVRQLGAILEDSKSKQTSKPESDKNHNDIFKPFKNQ